MIYTYDTSIMSVDGKEILVNDGGNMAALKTFSRLHDEKILDPSVWAGNGDPNTLFRSGKYGFHFSGNWMLRPYENLDFEIAIAPVPVGTTRFLRPRW